MAMAKDTARGFHHGDFYEFAIKKCRITSGGLIGVYHPPRLLYLGAARCEAR